MLHKLNWTPIREQKKQFLIMYISFIDKPSKNNNWVKAN